ncbi:MAG: prephenate dehydrogenase [Peptostreptococcaceae bacterium]|nr:prephenate dehydrogenase [Peptostreptococcaceae bacterium]
MKIGIIGLGLIGGSIAKAIKENTDHYVMGHDIDSTVVHKALLLNAIDIPLAEKDLTECQVIIVALYPKDTIKYITNHSHLFHKDAVVMDTCGVKSSICNALEPIAKKNGFYFMGAHPMAGTTHSGFNYSEKALFDNASMVITPLKGTPIEMVELIKKLCVSIGFTNTQIATPEEHDKVIAFTSQLAHIVSNAYVKSPTAMLHKGFSAGSYVDLTRVAKLNENMWNELFIDNKKFLASEIRGLIERLTLYNAALESSDEPALKTLLKEGSDLKIKIDGDSI